MTTSTRSRPVAFRALVACIAVAIALWAMRPYAVGVYHDDGVYVILAKALATGHGFRYLHLPGAPVAGHYPPAYPVLLALLWRLVPQFPGNIKLFLIVNAALVGVAAWYTQALGHRVLGWANVAAATAALLATATFPMLLLSGLVLSEPLFIACLLAMLVAAERFAAGIDGVQSTGTRSLVLGLGLGALGLVRAHALALALAAVLVLALRKRWRDAARCTIGVAAVVTPWAAWVHVRATPLPSGLAGSYGSYLGWFAAGVRSSGLHGVMATVATNAREIAELFADRWSLSGTAFVRYASAAVAVGAMVVGAWRIARRAPVMVTFLAIYLVVTLIWPFTPWRFVYAVWPVIVLCMGGAVAWGTGIHSRVGRAGALAGATLLAAGMVRAEARSDAARSWRTGTDEATATIAPLVRWVSAHTAPSDVVAADGEQLVYLFTGRTAVPIVPFTAAEYVAPRTVRMNAASISQLLLATHVDYLVTISPALRDAAEVIAQRHPAPGAPRLIPLEGVGAGEAFRVEHP